MLNRNDACQLFMECSKSEEFYRFSILQPTKGAMKHNNKKNIDQVKKNRWKLEKKFLHGKYELYVLCQSIGRAKIGKRL